MTAPCKHPRVSRLYSCGYPAGVRCDSCGAKFEGYLELERARERLEFPDRLDVLLGRLRVAGSAWTGPNGQLLLEAADAIRELRRELEWLKERP